MMDRQSAKPLYRQLYVQVLAAVVLGALLGLLAPEAGAAMRPLGDGFIRLIRMIVAPVIFGTVAVGIAKMGDIRNVGRIGVRALIYFEVVSTIALILGLVAVNLYEPGAGVAADPGTLDAASVASYTSSARNLGPVEFLTNIIPRTVVEAFATGEILQVLFVSVLFGLALLHVGDAGRGLVKIIDDVTQTLFGVVGIIMRAAPIGAFGGMAFTAGEYGVGTLVSLGKLIAGFYVACVLFVAVVLGAVAVWAGFSLVKFLRYIKEELLIVVGTSSSESVLPRMMAKLEHLGCSKPVVGLVLPAGYSFNLDGTAIYMPMAAVFIAQATGTALTIGDQLGLLAVLLLTSKGAAAIAGGGFVTLAATLAAVPAIPMAGLALLIGIDRFMSEARAITNLIGNGVATLAVARWDAALDARRMSRVLSGRAVEELGEPERALVAQAHAAGRQ
jgi:aerobic C4-dicarboxylate transport protein